MDSAASSEDYLNSTEIELLVAELEIDDASDDDILDQDNRLSETYKVGNKDLKESTNNSLQKNDQPNEVVSQINNRPDEVVYDMEEEKSKDLTSSAFVTSEQNYKPDEVVVLDDYQSSDDGDEEDEDEEEEEDGIKKSEFKDADINLFFDKVSVGQLVIPDYDIPETVDTMIMQDMTNETIKESNPETVDTKIRQEVTNETIKESNQNQTGVIMPLDNHVAEEEEDDDDLVLDLNGIPDLDLSNYDIDASPAEAKDILENINKDINQEGDEEVDDFFKKVEVDQQLYDEFGNLLTKPKSIFTTLDRFYPRPLSYLNLDIVNQADYNRQSQSLEAALSFLNSKKCKDLLAEVEPPESLGLLTVNVKDPLLKYTIVPPKSRKEYKEFRTIRPWFMWIITFVQAILVIVSFVMNYNNTGGVIQTVPFNPMIGPNPGILITLGARYLPCMKTMDGNWSDVICPAGILVRPPSNATCSLKEICGSASDGNLNQAWRFVTPIFLHSGIIHYILNAFFQLRVAANFEREVGSLQVAIIYMVSGIGGYIFGASFSKSAKGTPSVGSSGGLFGIIACLSLDLFMNWSLLKSPKWESYKTVLNIIIAFIMGWLPGVDNFAHIGGYIIGLFMGFMLMPKVYFSKKDRARKLIIQYLSFPIAAGFLVGCAYAFYKIDLDCPSCQYLNCVPGLPWCDQKGL